MVQDCGLTAGVIHTPYRMWGRAGVLTEIRGDEGEDEGWSRTEGSGWE